MLDQQDIKQITEIVKAETSDLRQDVSILKQDVSGLKQDVSVLKQDVSSLKQDVSELKQGQKDLFRHMNVLHENLKDELKLVVENVGSMIKQALVPIQNHVYENHEKRISSLEAAFKRKMA